MKIEKPGGIHRTRAASGPYASARDASAAPSVPAAPISASVFGIPENEFTPRVRDAIMLLMKEVEQLRREVERAHSRLEDVARAADQDVLLPILNRRAFTRELSRFIAFAERHGTTSSLVYFDLDDFKSVNDEHGHAAGDAVLRHFADVISTQVRGTDVLGRLGGDEFGIILAHITLDQAMKKASNLAAMLRERPAPWQNRRIELSFTYGITELSAGANADSAIAQADTAMYARKKSETRARKPDNGNHRKPDKGK